MKAVNDLKKEGLKINLKIIEKVSNTEVKRILSEEADILVEQIVFTGYALSAMEGFSAGLPVISNLERNDLTQVFRRYSYLDECPILSGTPENIKDRIKKLVVQPDLRKKLGEAGREYAVKYHSYSAYQFLFEKIIEKIWYNQPVDTMNIYNPQNSEAYNNLSSFVKHPLINNGVPV